MSNDPKADGRSLTVRIRILEDAISHAAEVIRNKRDRSDDHTMRALADYLDGVLEP